MHLWCPQVQFNFEAVTNGLHVHRSVQLKTGYVSKNDIPCNAAKIFHVLIIAPSSWSHQAACLLSIGSFQFCAGVQSCPWCSWTALWSFVDNAIFWISLHSESIPSSGTTCIICGCHKLFLPHCRWIDSWPWAVCVVCSTIYAVRGASHSRFKSWISRQVSMRNLGLPICVVFLQASCFPPLLKKKTFNIMLQRLTTHLILEFCCVAIMKLLYLLPSPGCSSPTAHNSFCQQKKSNTTSCISSPCIFETKSKASWNTLSRLMSLFVSTTEKGMLLFLPECRTISGQSRYRCFPAHQSTNTLKPKIKLQGFSKYCWPGAKCGCGSGPQTAALPF